MSFAPVVKLMLNNNNISDCQLAMRGAVVVRLVCIGLMGCGPAKARAYEQPGHYCHIGV